MTARTPSIKRSIKRVPERILGYGPEGVGKSTFASQMPDTLFLDIDDSTRRLDVARVGDWTDPSDLPPQNYDELIAVIRLLASSPEYRTNPRTGKPYQTLALETADRIEQVFIHPETARRWKPENNKPQPENIDEIGFNKGYPAALRVWAEFLGELDKLQAQTGMNLIILSHSRIATVTNLGGEDFSTYEPDLYASKNASAAALLREWADCVLFMVFDDVTRGQTKEEQQLKKAKRGITTGRRFAYTVHQGWAMAKNRTGLPEKIELSWKVYCDHVDAFYAGHNTLPGDLPTLRKMILSQVEDVKSWAETPADWSESTFKPYLDSCGDNVDSLRTTLALLNQKIDDRKRALLAPAVATSPAAA